MSVIIYVSSFLFSRLNKPVSQIFFHSMQTSPPRQKNAVSKDLLTKKTFLCLTGFLEQALLRDEAILQMPYCGKEKPDIQSIRVHCKQNEIWENSVIEGFNGDHFSNVLKKSNL